MSLTLTLVIALLIVLIILMSVALMLYHLTRQDLQALSGRLNALDMAKASPPRNSDTVRRERAAAFDKLVMLEASLNGQERDQLTAEELDLFEDARRIIKSCNAELKRTKDWMGLPFDLEWAEVKERVPHSGGLYRLAVEAAMKKGEEFA
jgi:hypothetical protein